MGSATIHTVAVLAASPALSSILSAVLAGAAGLRVRQFESAKALETYMRIAPVDLVVADYDFAEAPADRLASALRHDGQLARRSFQIIALAHALGPDSRDKAVSAGIDEVIVKPMSPRYLLERVTSRLRSRPAHVAARSGYTGPERRGRLPTRDFSGYGANVIPLFGRRRSDHRPGFPNS